ncbi:MAG TPA: CBS domain-containing protein [Rhizomicrobium sp.]|nr:CBS domain-containing protein [Rhizomicrobium sp.]
MGEVMTKNCRFVNANDTLRKAAEIMAAEDVGILPVADKDRLIGMISDRDIVTRSLARGGNGKAHVRDVMTKNVKYCFEDADLDDTLENMAEIQVRRLPVMNREKRLVGIVSLSDAARAYSPDAVGIAFSGVVTPVDDDTIESGIV